MKSVNRGNAGQDAPCGITAGCRGWLGMVPIVAGKAPLRAARPARAGPGAVPLRELMDDRLLDELLERSRDAAGGLRLTGEGSMLGELVKAVLERALEAELTAHLGYGQEHSPSAVTSLFRDSARRLPAFLPEIDLLVSIALLRARSPVAVSQCWTWLR